MKTGEGTAGRFERHFRIADWRQENLSSATVVVAGVGALGSEVTRILAMSGVGHLILADPDRVEESNLSRAPLFRESDIGRYKTDAAADYLRGLAPGIRIDARADFFQRAIGLADLRDASLVIGCLDSRASRVDVAARCSLVGARSIDGGTHPWGGEVRLFLEETGPCYGCGMTPAQRAETDTPQSCAAPPRQGGEGAAAPSSALVGAWLAALAVRYLMGLAVPSGAVHIDMSRGSSSSVELVRDAGCPFHSRLASARQIPLDHRATLGELSLALGGRVPVLWYPVRRFRRCGKCGFRDEPWLPALPPTCPSCGANLPHGSVLDLQEAPRGRMLGDLGIPPREILPVRTPQGYEYVELAGEGGTA